jgi:hypothetical protein
MVILLIMLDATRAGWVNSGVSRFLDYGSKPSWRFIMRRNKQDITIRQDADPVAKFSFWSGLLSIPSSVFLLGIPLGIIARYMGGKVLNRSENIPTSEGSVGKAQLGRYFGCTGIILSVVWGVILIVMVVVEAIGSLWNAIFK